MSGILYAVTIISCYHDQVLTVEVGDCSEQSQFLQEAIETCQLEVTLPSGLGRCDFLSLSLSRHKFPSFIGILCLGFM